MKLNPIFKMVSLCSQDDTNHWASSEYNILIRYVVTLVEVSVHHIPIASSTVLTGTRLTEFILCTTSILFSDFDSCNAFSIMLKNL